MKSIIVATMLLAFSLACSALDISPATKSLTAVYGVPFTQSFTATGAQTPPLTWSLGTEVPPWLKIVRTGVTTARIYGTPDVIGTWRLSVNVRDSRPSRLGGSRKKGYFYQTTVAQPPITFSPETIHAGTKNRRYDQILGVLGPFTAPVTWAASGLPAGLSVEGGASAGVGPLQAKLRGFPTVSGSFSPTITARGKNGVMASKRYQLVIDNSSSIIPASLPDAQRGFPYAARGILAANIQFLPPLEWKIETGTLPEGLWLRSGALGGVGPQQAKIGGTASEAGTFEFTVSVEDSRGLKDSRSYTLAVDAVVPVRPEIAETDLEDAHRAKEYEAALTATGGALPLRWRAVSPAMLPRGLRLNQDGTIAGTPKYPGEYRFRVRVEDQLLRFDIKQVTLVVHARVPGICPQPLTATAKIPTGLVTLAIAGRVPSNPRIDWGDGSDPEEALLHCTGSGEDLVCEIMGHHTYSAVGEYEATVHVGREDGEGIEAATSVVTVQPLGDYIIVSMGDSVASGEGNPVLRTQLLPRSHPAYWDLDKVEKDDGNWDNVHRSRKAGPALAAAQYAAEYESEHPGRRVTFLHLADSGAKIGNLAAQIEEARTALGDRSIDVLLVSIGANHVGGGFGKLVKTCLSPDDCSQDAGFARELRESVTSLNGEFEEREEGVFTAPENTYQWLDLQLSYKLRVKDIFITEYFDPTRGASGEFPTLRECLKYTGGLLIPAEWEFLHDEVVVPLNGAIQEAVDSINAHQTDARTGGTRPNWHYVGGIAEAFRTHGYCTPAPKSWVVHADESIRWQNDLDDDEEDADTSGTAHPDPDGHGVYRDAIVAAIKGEEPRLTLKGTRALTSWSQVQDVEPVDAVGDPATLATRVMQYLYDLPVDLDWFEDPRNLQPIMDRIPDLGGEGPELPEFRIKLPVRIPEGLSAVIETTGDGLSWDPVAWKRGGLDDWQVELPVDLRVTLPEDGLETVIINLKERLGEAPIGLFRLGVFLDN